jgi:hypothetical protein
MKERNIIMSYNELKAKGYEDSNGPVYGKLRHVKPQSEWRHFCDNCGHPIIMHTISFRVYDPNPNYAVCNDGIHICECGIIIKY